MSGNTGIMLAPDEYEGPGGEIVQADQRLQMSPGQLEAITRAEFETQIVMAKKFPRSVKNFLSQTRSLAMLTPEISDSCCYALPRGKDRMTGKKKFIEGPSVRLAEIALSCWGNSRVQSRIVEETRTHVTAEAIGIDLERVVVVKMEAQRSILDSNGKKFRPDMILVTGMAAQSIAARNATWKVVPMAFIHPIYLECRRLASGEGMSVEQRRENVLKWIKYVNVTEAELYAMLGIASIEELTVDHMAIIAGIKTSIRDGEATVDQIFRGNGPITPTTNGSGPAALPAPDTKMARMTQEMNQAAQKPKSEPKPEPVQVKTPEPVAAKVAAPQPLPEPTPTPAPVVVPEPTPTPQQAPQAAEVPFVPNDQADDRFEGEEDFPTKAAQKPMASSMPAPSSAPWTAKGKRKGTATPPPSKELFTGDEDRGGWTEKSG